MTDNQCFPRNEAGEPLMDGAAWSYEQSLDADTDFSDFDDQWADAHEEEEF